MVHVVVGTVLEVVEEGVIVELISVTALVDVILSCTITNDKH